MFHLHKWQEVYRGFNPPRHSVDIEGAGEEFVRKLSSGFTTIELKCVKCGNLKHIEVIGNVTK